MTDEKKLREIHKIIKDLCTDFESTLKFIDKNTTDFPLYQAELYFQYGQLLAILEDIEEKMLRRRYG